MILSKTLSRYGVNMVRVAALAVTIGLIPVVIGLDIAVWYVGLKTTHE